MPAQNHSEHRVVDQEQGGRPRTTPRRWVSLARACEILGVNESTVRRWADSGEINVFRTPGGHRRFAEEELLTLVESGGRRPERELENAAVSRIRRQLHSPHTDAGWYREIEQAERDALRPLGRRLVEIVDDYLARRGRRPELEEEVSEIGARTVTSCSVAACRSRRPCRRSPSSAARSMRPRSSCGAEPYERR
jgi:excisionase family DNA binding protein